MSVTTRLCLILTILFGATAAHAWGPHPDITRAALQVQPERARWIALVGEGQYNALASYAWMPDQQGQDFSEYYPDDYLLFHAVPVYAGHGMPRVAEAWEPFFRRGLQALRTESPVNACRMMGSLLHYVEDSGAPPHARPIGTLHGPLENWVKAAEIKIDGYVPQLLGTDDDAAVAGLRRRMEGLVAFSILRADRGKPLAEQGEAMRPQVEPILLESALECARVTADVIHTLGTLAQAPLPPGGALQGTISAPEFSPGVPRRNAKAARIFLLDDARYRALGAQPETLAPALTDYGTNATTVGTVQAGPWQGEYRFRNLPPGTYRVLAVRAGAGSVVSAPVAVTAGQTAVMDLRLPGTEPPGNLMQNADGRLSILRPGPDRWAHPSATQWIGAQAALEPGMTYRCGAILKDPGAKVTFQFEPGVKLELPVATGPTGAEVTYACTARNVAAVAVIESPRPLAEVIERVWAVAVPPATL